jgi:4-hydroxy-L-threonine phosphate dehydrogenase PdxA
MPLGKKKRKKYQIKQIGNRPFLAMTTPINFLSAYLSAINREYIRTCVIAKSSKRENFRVNSENPAVYIRGVNPHGEVKGSISYSESQTITAKSSNGSF